jgi:ribosomal protein S18 acetylase RimI-like enzyme
MITMRRARSDDHDFMAAMLLEAFTWSPELPRLSIDEMLRDPHISLYIDDWGREGDAGVVAENAAGAPVGAAWYRFFTDELHGFGYIDAATPEITIGVCAEARGQGTGRRLLEALLDVARETGVDALALSVEPTNIPARTLYERLGFEPVGQVRGSWTMRRLIG